MNQSLSNDTQDEPGGHDVPLGAPEVSVWMTAYGCLRQLREIEEAFKASEITSKAYFRCSNQMLLELAETADATHRFGIVLPVVIEPYYKSHMRNGDVFINIKFSDFFWRWYNWWDDYMKTRPKEERNLIYRLVVERLPEVNAHRPAGDWPAYRREPSLHLFRKISPAAAV